MIDLVKVGSETAKGGFANERAIVEKFNSWEKDKEAKKWLNIMGYDLNEIKEVKAVILHGYKTDVQVEVLVKMKEAVSVENLSIKKANKDSDYNQIDKRWVSHYKELWGFSEDVEYGLKIFCGEISPNYLLKKGMIRQDIYDSLRDKRRFFLNELMENLRKEVISFFSKNKILIVSDLIKGRGKFSANWMLVTRYNKDNNTTSWVLKSINEAMQVFGEGNVRISPQGSLYIGRITMQRKGGDAGRATANMLQFKMSPNDLF